MREREYLRSPEESRRSSRDSVISRDTAPSLAAASFSQCSTTSLPSLANLIFSPEPSTVGSPYRQIRSSGSFTHNHDGRVSTDRTKSGLHISPNQRLGTSSEIRSAEEVPEKCMTNSSGGRLNVDVRQDDGIETYELKNRDRNKGMLSARQLLRENLSSSEKQQVREVNREQGEEEGSSFDYDVFPALMSIECERVESGSKAYPAAIPSTSISRDDLCQDYHHPNTPTSSTPFDNGNQIHTPGRLKNPPKSLWAEYFDSVSGLLYYHNRSTKETKWERPTDDEMSLPLHLVSSLPDMT